MKKLTILSVAVLAMSLASCKKDHKCTCTTTSSAGGGSSTPDVTTYVKVSKGTAKANCVSSTRTNNGVTDTETCTLS